MDMIDIDEKKQFLIYQREKQRVESIFVPNRSIA